MAGEPVPPGCGSSSLDDSAAPGPTLQRPLDVVGKPSIGSHLGYAAGPGLLSAPLKHHEEHRDRDEHEEANRRHGPHGADLTERGVPGVRTLGGPRPSSARQLARRRSWMRWHEHPAWPLSTTPSSRRPPADGTARRRSTTWNSDREDASGAAAARSPALPSDAGGAELAHLEHRAGAVVRCRS